LLNALQCSSLLDERVEWEALQDATLGVFWFYLRNASYIVLQFLICFLQL